MSDIDTFYRETNRWLLLANRFAATGDEIERCFAFGSTPKEAAEIIAQERDERAQHEARDEEVRQAAAVHLVPDDVAAVALKQFRRERPGLPGEVLDVMERAILADRATRSELGPWFVDDGDRDDLRCIFGADGVIVADMRWHTSDEVTEANARLIVAALNDYGRLADNMVIETEVQAAISVPEVVVAELRAILASVAQPDYNPTRDVPAMRQKAEGLYLALLKAHSDRIERKSACRQGDRATEKRVEVRAWLVGDAGAGQWIEIDEHRIAYSRGLGRPVVALAEAFKRERDRADAAEARAKLNPTDPSLRC